MLEEEELKDAVLMVFANKQDLPNALATDAIAERLGLSLLKNRCTSPPPSRLMHGRRPWMPAASVPPARRLNTWCHRRQGPPPSFRNVGAAGRRDPITARSPSQAMGHLQDVRHKGRWAVRRLGLVGELATRGQMSGWSSPLVPVRLPPVPSASWHRRTGRGHQLAVARGAVRMRRASVASPLQGEGRLARRSVHASRSQLRYGTHADVWGGAVARHADHASAARGSRVRVSRARQLVPLWHAVTLI